MFLNEDIYDLEVLSALKRVWYRPPQEAFQKVIWLTHRFNPTMDATSKLLGHLTFYNLPDSDTLKMF